MSADDREGREAALAEATLARMADGSDRGFLMFEGHWKEAGYYRGWFLTCVKGANAGSKRMVSASFGNGLRVTVPFVSQICPGDEFTVGRFPIGAEVETLVAA